MPAPNTEMQQKFAVSYATNGGDHKAAAIEAGYSEHSAQVLGRRMLDLPHVQEMIMLALLGQKARAGAIGLDALIHVAKSATAPAAAKVAAGRVLIEFAGLASKEVEQDPRGLVPRPDYKSILDSFAEISKATISDTVQ